VTPLANIMEYVLCQIHVLVHLAGKEPNVIKVRN